MPPGHTRVPASGSTVTSAKYGTVVEVRYDPFDLARVFIFRDTQCVETTSVSKLVNRTAPLSEESKAAPHEVSAHASAYFQALREQHLTSLTNNPSPVSYSKLAPKDAK